MSARLMMCSQDATTTTIEIKSARVTLNAVKTWKIISAR